MLECYSPILKTYLCAPESEEGEGLDDVKRNEWQTTWLQTVDSQHIIDMLVVASFLKIQSLCTLILSKQKFLDIPYELSSSLTDSEKEQIQNIHTGLRNK